MTTTAIPFSDLAQGLREIGQQELLPRFEADIAVDYKADGSVITEADHAVDARVRTLLGAYGQDTPVLSEEQARGEQARVLETAPAFWLVDPLDGTSNFAGGMPFFAISIARIEGDRVTHGATYDPVREELFTATEDSALELNGVTPPATTRPPVTELGRAIALVDYKRLDAPLAGELACNAPFRSQRNLGACALEWAWLAAGRADLYLHGGQAPWDSAAGGLMLARAGGAMCNLAGEPVFGRSLTKRSAVAARSDTLLADWRAWLAPWLAAPETPS
ncbi:MULTISPECIES: inositol monophosphatase family protein [Thioalkalivibrio]|uniref:Inositol monophosphatase n=1 Tax=Thioalkalivibrio versutus TaxID=106634 RepID=A0A0G3G3B4_9GAMM|nr:MULTISPECIES: inositol monophosphatase family protein [Thioalkalivibrio]AKJ94022.1 inositol monophosphatase [Thioalkalivibrio versutus]